MKTLLWRPEPVSAVLDRIASAVARNHTVLAVGPSSLASGWQAAEKNNSMSGLLVLIVGVLFAVLGFVFFSQFATNDAAAVESGAAPSGVRSSPSSDHVGPAAPSSCGSSLARGETRRKLGAKSFPGTPPVAPDCRGAAAASSADGPSTASSSWAGGPSEVSASLAAGSEGDEAVAPAGGGFFPQSLTSLQQRASSFMRAWTRPVFEEVDESEATDCGAWASRVAANSRAPAPPAASANGQPPVPGVAEPPPAAAHEAVQVSTSSQAVSPEARAPGDPLAVKEVDAVSQRLVSNAAQTASVTFAAQLEVPSISFPAGEVARTLAQPPPLPQSADAGIQTLSSNSVQTAAPVDSKIARLPSRAPPSSSAGIAPDADSAHTPQSTSAATRPVAGSAQALIAAGLPMTPSSARAGAIRRVPVAPSAVSQRTACHEPHGRGSTGIFAKLQSVKLRVPPPSGSGHAELSPQPRRDGIWPEACLFDCRAKADIITLKDAVEDIEAIPAPWNFEALERLLHSHKVSTERWQPDARESITQELQTGRARLRLGADGRPMRFVELLLICVEYPGGKLVLQEECRAAKYSRLPEKAPATRLMKGERWVEAAKRQLEKKLRFDPNCVRIDNTLADVWDTVETTDFLPGLSSVVRQYLARVEVIASDQRDLMQLGLSSSEYRPWHLAAERQVFYRWVSRESALGLMARLRRSKGVTHSLTAGGAAERKSRKPQRRSVLTTVAGMGLSACMLPWDEDSLQTLCATHGVSDVDAAFGQALPEIAKEVASGSSFFGLRRSDRKLLLVRDVVSALVPGEEEGKFVVVAKHVGMAPSSDCAEFAPCSIRCADESVTEAARSAVKTDLGIPLKDFDVVDEETAEAEHNPTWTKADLSKLGTDLGAVLPWDPAAGPPPEGRRVRHFAVPIEAGAIVYPMLNSASAASAASDASHENG